MSGFVPGVIRAQTTMSPPSARSYGKPWNQFDSKDCQIRPKTEYFDGALCWLGQRDGPRQALLKIPSRFSFALSFHSSLSLIQPIDQCIQRLQQRLDQRRLISVGW